ncbi:MAG TPA: radical SAM family heme chaperone HemW [Gaiellaceae bacterium]|nr:radical SAM family heme chaperone HemW [Gaiellaceae bacterium]
MSVRHLYVHLPFCSSRCGYCDFVTVVGRDGEHDRYVGALLAELELERHLLAPTVETVYLGGGTPTLIAPAALRRLLGGLPAAAEVTVEANPETVTPDLAELLAAHATRVSLGAQSFSDRLLRVLDRAARPDDVRRAVAILRDAGIPNLSLDLIYGVPGQTPAALEHDLECALELAPEHISAYELEAKAGTRFTHAHGAELVRQADALEAYFERVVETLTNAGYRWYETANFCRSGERDLRARHNLGYWLGRDYLGLGIGAVSTVAGRRWRNAPSLPRYLAALARGERPEREHEELPTETRALERVMLGLRLDEPLPLAGLEATVDAGELERLAGAGLVERTSRTLSLTPRGRLLGGGVTARLLA